MAARRLFSILLLLVYFAVAAESKSTYRAAIVEYESYFRNHMKPIDLLLTNAQNYTEFVSKAAQLNIDIIVFPEYGIKSLRVDSRFNFTRDGILPYLQTVPDPLEVTWNPCLNPTNYSHTEILQLLSCSAKNNSVAILANILSREECNKQSDPNCPDDGRYQYNTNIVFDKNGLLIARYHKKHLFGESLLDSPKETEYIIFIIDGIKFATFTCFDIMHSDPAEKLIHDYGIKNILFPTAWISYMPFLLGPQTWAKWARSLGVNLIVSNNYSPRTGGLGSGLYSSQLGALNETFDISRKDELIFADLPIDPSAVAEENMCSSSPIQKTTPITDTTDASYIPFIRTDKPTSKPVESIHKISYQPLSNFSTIYLNETQGNVSLCQKEVCCNLVYSFSCNNDEEIYVLGVFDGAFQVSKYKMGIQVCSVLRCENTLDIESCGRVPKITPTAKFHQLSLTGELKGDYVLPSVLKDDLQLLAAEDWSFSHKKCNEENSQSKIELRNEGKSIIVASLFTRIYSRDDIKK